MKKTLRARRRRRRALLAAAALLLCLGGVSLVSAIVRLPVHSVPDAPLADGEPEKTSPEKKENTQEKEASPEDGEKDNTSLKETPKEEEPSPSPETPYDYSQPVPESAPGAEGDFQNSLFIGNSITDGIALGCISYVVVMVCRKRWAVIDPWMYVLAGVFALMYLLAAF